jgi:hypothetical protein
MSQQRLHFLQGRGLKDCIEEDQTQDWDLNWNWNREKGMGGRRVASGGGRAGAEDAVQKRESQNSNSSNFNSNSRPRAHEGLISNSQMNRTGDASSPVAAGGHRPASAMALPDASSTGPHEEADPVRRTVSFTAGDKALAVARELRVGQGPVCGPARVRPEVLERIRLREAARAGSRSP